METYDVVYFRPYPFKKGQKINIESGPRKGDWEVVDTSKRKVTLRCPISHKKFEWDLFCYFTEERTGNQWPHPD